MTTTPRTMFALMATATAAATIALAPAAHTEPDSPPAIAAHGVEAPLGAVPWSQVGPGWMLAMWSPVPGLQHGESPPAGSPTWKTSATTLYLVDPAGGRYPITTFPPPGNGESPKLVDWSRVHIFFGDERHVPPDHADSNYRMAKETLLSKVLIPAANVHRIQTENPDAAKAAEQYDRELVKAFQLNGEDQMPRLDLIFLGMGPDGHTASLFPGTTAVHELKKRVVANWVPKFNTCHV